MLAMLKTQHDRLAGQECDLGVWLDGLVPELAKLITLTDTGQNQGCLQNGKSIPDAHMFTQPEGYESLLRGIAKEARRIEFARCVEVLIRALDAID